MGNKWNEFFEKQALEDMKATEPPNPTAGDVSENETEKAGENAEKALNDQKNEQNETESENETEKKGTEENESTEQETGRKENV